MKIRSAARPGETGAAENTFIAVDELENKLGSCTVEEFDRGETMPGRSYELLITADGESSAVSQLMGTAFTRALILAKNKGVNARIYAECAPDDQQKLEMYAALGLRDDDALVRMSLSVVPGGSISPLPKDCIYIEDDLSDPRERRFFLDRQAKLFSRKNAEEWLQKASRNYGFRRMLLTTREGLAGELVCWVENGHGMIGMVYTAPKWRRKGVALHLMECARQYFYSLRVRESHVRLRTRQTALVRLAASAGYRQSKVYMRLPGMNLDAPKKQKLY